MDTMTNNVEVNAGAYNIPINLDITNIINLCLLVATIIIFIMNMRFTKKEHWISLFMSFNDRYAKIRWSLPNDILADDYDVRIIHKDLVVQNTLRQYYDLCSEEFFLKEKKNWISDELWEQWHSGIEYYVSKPAFREAWKIFSNDEEYYLGFKEYIDNIVKQTA